ncbi:MAG: NAD(P)-dependent oxidoreductase [Chryseolinea sp.]
MEKIRVGLIRESKSLPDKRVAFTPQQAQEVEQLFPYVKLYCEESLVRCFDDSEYRGYGVEVVSDISFCDILMGIKEVPIANLIPEKTYLFFSHTIKRQSYNRTLLKEIIKKRIRLIDYEALKDSQGNRLVAFGRYAGIVGAYNSLWTYGKRFGDFSIRRAFQCYDVNDLKLELRKVKLPSIKIILTGAGRVGRGAMETLDTAGIRKVSPHDFLLKGFDSPVYVQLSSGDYHTRIDGGAFNRAEFHQYPERYRSSFIEFTKVADILLAGAFWNPGAPVLFTLEQMRSHNFKIKIIADITCDIKGSIPATVKAASITEPIYDFDPMSGTDKPPLSDQSYITVMAVDNLPCELPRSASEEFGRDLIDRILKPLLMDDPEGLIDRGTIAVNGSLTENFLYLSDYVAQDSELT